MSECNKDNCPFAMTIADHSDFIKSVRENSVEKDLAQLKIIVQNLDKLVTELQKQVNSILGMPAKRWETIVMTIITVILSTIVMGAVTFIMSKGI